MIRVSFEEYADELRAQGFSEEQIKDVFKEMLDTGLCEGNDEDGFSLTEKGLYVLEEPIYRSLGVV